MPPRPNRPHRQSRTGNQSVWIFGRHAVLAALANPDRRIERLFATREMAEAHAAEIGKTDKTITSREDLNQRLPNGSVHQGIAALVAPLEDAGIEDVLARCGENALVLALDQVSDPHNVGAILRSAAAFGAAGVIVTDRHTPSDTGTLAKAASGALEIVPLVRAVNLARALDQLKEAGFWTYGLAESGDAPHRRPRPQGPDLHRAGRRGRRPAPADRGEMRPAGDNSHQRRALCAQRFQRCRCRGLRMGAAATEVIRVNLRSDRPDRILERTAEGLATEHPLHGPGGLPGR